MPNYAIQLDQRERSVLEALGIADPNTALNEEDVAGYRHNTNLHIHQFDPAANQIAARSGKLFLMNVLMLPHYRRIDMVDIVTTLADDFSLDSAADENDFNGFTQDELDFLSARYAQINLLSRDGQMISSIVINDDRNLPLITLINPFPLTQDCLQFLLEISTPSPMMDLPIGSVSRAGSPYSSSYPSTGATSSTMPLWGSQGNPSQNLSGFSMTETDLKSSVPEEEDQFHATIRQLVESGTSLASPALKWSPSPAPAVTPKTGSEEDEDEDAAARARKRHKA